MEAEFKYTKEDIEKLILNFHKNQFFAPTGKDWKMAKYSYGEFTVVMNDIEEVHDEPADSPSE